MVTGEESVTTYVTKKDIENMKSRMDTSMKEQMERFEKKISDALKGKVAEPTIHKTATAEIVADSARDESRLPEISKEDAAKKAKKKSGSTRRTSTGPLLIRDPVLRRS